MESEFQKMRKDKIKNQKNKVLLEVTIYVIAVLILFGLGGKIADLATGDDVPLISIDGMIKLIAIIFFLILLAIIFIPGPIMILADIVAYIKIRY